MVTQEYSRYENFGISIDIPAHLKIEVENAGFSASSKDGRATMALEVDPADVIWDATESMMRQPLGVNSLLRSHILREGPIETPYAGYERLVEHFMEATGETDFGWLLTMSTGAHRFILQVGDFCPFAVGEALWSKVVQSLRVGDQ